MNQLVSLNGEKLKTIANANPTAEAALLALALRRRMREFLDLKQYKRSLLKEGAKIVDSDYQQVWKDLEKAGIGSIIYGRKGKPDRFKWNYSLKSVGKAAIEGSNEKVERLEVSAEVSAPKRKRGRPAKKKIAPSSTVIGSTEVNSVYIPLRPTVRIRINLPKDLTEQERQVIIDAIKTV